MENLLLSGCQHNEAETADNLETVAESERYAHEVYTPVNDTETIAQS